MSNIANAFNSIPREKFFLDEYKEFATYDAAFPIGGKSTISQPSTIKIMLKMLDLKKGQKVLEIGSGSGYVLALINNITKEKVFGIELNKEVAKRSIKVLKELGVDAKVVISDGKKGMKTQAPFDRIIISAGTKKVPKELFKQLNKSGKLVCPVGVSELSMVLYDSKENILEETGSFMFVKLE